MREKKERGGGTGAQDVTKELKATSGKNQRKGADTRAGKNKRAFRGAERYMGRRRPRLRKGKVTSWWKEMRDLRALRGRRHRREIGPEPEV